MNCCLWIILLLACRGNCGMGCRNNYTIGSGCQDMRYDEDDDCDVCCGRRNYMMDRGDDCGCMEHSHEDCGCMNHMHDDGGYSDNCRENETYDREDTRRGYEAYDRDDNRMGYETYGCQENGIPCPPPVPGNYMR